MSAALNQTYAPGEGRSLPTRQGWRQRRSAMDRVLDLIHCRSRFGLLLAAVGVVETILPAFVFSIPPHLMPQGFCVALSFATTLLCVALIPVFALGLLITLAEHERLPVSLPFSAFRKDPNDNWKKASGCFYIGAVRQGEPLAGQQVWATAEQMLEHFLVLGTTGSGKSQFLISLAANALAMGGGFVFSDAKAESGLPWFLYGLACMVGAEDDFLLINYMTGSRPVKGKTRERLSNTSNPFAIGSADALAEMMIGMLPGDDKGENAIFRGRAVTLMRVLLTALVELRNQGRIQLGVRKIREFLTLPRVAGLAGCLRDELGGKRVFEKPPGSEEQVADQYWDCLSPFAREALRGYINSIPGYQFSLPPALQPQEPNRQHGFAQFYWTQALSDFAETYQHIYGSDIGEIDYKDVVLNRRILVIMLPALEKSTDALNILGKIGLSSIRIAMSTGLGAGIEGSRQEVLEAKPSAANHPILGFPLPMVDIFDEYGYQAANGFAVTAAQARGLGFSCVFAGQDLPGFKQSNERETWQIVANTKLKIFMSLEDPKDTYDLAKSLGGETFAERVHSYNVQDADKAEAQITVERTARVDILDLKGQGKGEAHLYWLDRVFRINCFYINPKKPSELQVNRFVGIAPPTPDEAQLLCKMADSVAGRGGASSALAPPPHRAEWRAVNDALANLPFPLDVRRSLNALCRAVLGEDAGLADNEKQDMSPQFVAPHGDTPEPAESETGGEPTNVAANVGVGSRPGGESDHGSAELRRTSAAQGSGPGGSPSGRSEAAGRASDTGDESGDAGRGPMPSWARGIPAEAEVEATSGESEAGREELGRALRVSRQQEKIVPPPFSAPSPDDESERKFEAVHEVGRLSYEAFGEPVPEDLAEKDRDVERTLAERTRDWPDASAPTERKPEDDTELDELVATLREAGEAAQPGA